MGVIGHGSNLADRVLYRMSAAAPSRTFCTTLSVVCPRLTPQPRRLTKTILHDRRKGLEANPTAPSLLF